MHVSLRVVQVQQTALHWQLQAQKLNAVLRWCENVRSNCACVLSRGDSECFEPFTCNQVMEALKSAQGSRALMSKNNIETKEVKQQRAALQAQLKEAQDSRNYFQAELQRSKQSEERLKGAGEALGREMNANASVLPDPFYLCAEKLRKEQAESVTPSAPSQQVRSLKSENESLMRQLDIFKGRLNAMNLKCSDAEATIARQHEQIVAMQAEKEGAAAAQGERVATIERMQRLQFQSKLELTASQDKIRLQDERIRKLESEQRILRATPAVSTPTSAQPQHRSWSDRGKVLSVNGSSDAESPVRNPAGSAVHEWSGTATQMTSIRNSEAERNRTRNANIRELQGLLQEVAPHTANQWQTVLPSQLLRRTPMSAGRETRGDATVESPQSVKTPHSLIMYDNDRANSSHTGSEAMSRLQASPPADQRLMGSRGPVLLDVDDAVSDVSPIVQHSDLPASLSTHSRAVKHHHRKGVIVSDDGARCSPNSSCESPEYRI